MEAELVGHGARRDEEGGFFAQHVGHRLLKQVDGGILAIHIVAYGCCSHSLAHRLTGHSHSVATQVDRPVWIRHHSSLTPFTGTLMRFIGVSRPVVPRLPGWWPPW